MRAQEEKGLTDNAWVQRIGYLRQTVSDQYDTTQDTTPQQFIDWLIESAEEEYDQADERIMLRWAQELKAEADEQEA